MILDNDRICSRHFISGKPAYLHDETNPDWLPSLHLGHSKKVGPRKETTERWERLKARREAAQSLLSLGEPSYTESAVHNEEDQQKKINTSTQTELTHVSIEELQKELERSKQEIYDIQSKHKGTFSEEYFASDGIVKFYTGLPNLKVLKAVFDLVKKVVAIKVTV